MAPKKKRQRKNKKWIPWKELTQEEREQLRRESDKKSFRKLLKETKDRTKAAEASGNYLDMLHAPRPTNEDYSFNTAEKRHVDKWDVHHMDEEDDEDSFGNDDIEWSQQTRFVNPEDINEDNELKQETLVERIRRNQERINDLEKENALLKMDLRDLEHLMKDYAANM